MVALLLVLRNLVVFPREGWIKMKNSPVYGVLQSLNVLWNFSELFKLCLWQTAYTPDTSHKPLSQSAH